MEIEEFLESRKVENPLESLRKGLELNSNLGFIGKFFSNSKLNREVAAVGINILDLHGYGYPYGSNTREKACKVL